MTKVIDKKARVKTWLFCAWNLAFVLARRSRIAFSSQPLGTLYGTFPMAKQELAGVRFGDRGASQISGQTILAVSQASGQIERAILRPLGRILDVLGLPAAVKLR